MQQSQAQLSAVRSAVAGALRLETNSTPTHADKQLVLDNIQALLPNSEQRLHAINVRELSHFGTVSVAIVPKSLLNA